jgi:hypothetical protein
MRSSSIRQIGRRRLIFHSGIVDKLNVPILIATAYYSSSLLRSMIEQVVNVYRHRSNSVGLSWPEIAEHRIENSPRLFFRCRFWQFDIVHHYSFRTSLGTQGWSRPESSFEGFLQTCRKRISKSISPGTRALLTQNSCRIGELDMWATKHPRMPQRQSNISTKPLYECRRLGSRLQDQSVTIDPVNH